MNNKNMNIDGPKSNQIMNNNLKEEVKNNVKKTYTKLEPGKSAITMQGGIVYPLMYKEVLAGEKIKDFKIQSITRLVTPLVPTMDKVYMNIKAFFVPHTRVWEDAEEIIAGKAQAGKTNHKNSKIPHHSIEALPTHNVLYKNTLVARYGLANKLENATEINVLPLRGYRAIFNDFIRNKEYEQAHTEWKTTEVGTTEANALKAGTSDPTSQTMNNQLVSTNYYTVKAGQTRNSYLTNIKKEVINDTEEVTSPSNILNHIEWETNFQDLKQRIDNANKNDQEIIAEMGGTSVVRTDRVEYLGELDYELNYQQITQSTPTTDGTPLGTTGSFSFTNITGTIFREKEFKQHGIIHILAQLQVDKLYMDGTPKELLKINVSDIYRPTLANKQVQTLMRREVSPLGTNQAIAFQPPYAEYKRMPTLVSGEMREEGLNKTSKHDFTTVDNSHWHNLVSSKYTFGADTAIGRDYFRNIKEVNQVLSRNSAIKAGDLFHNDLGGMFMHDPVLVMSEHLVTSMLPIEEWSIEGTSSSKKLL